MTLSDLPKYSKLIVLFGLFAGLPMPLFSTERESRVSNTCFCLYKSPDFDPVNFKTGTINFYDRDGDLAKEAIPGFKLVKFADSRFGRAFILPIVKSRPVANLVGWYKKTRFSLPKNIKTYAKKNNIELADFKPPAGQRDYFSFNDFFTRELSAQGLRKRSFTKDKNQFSSPADSKLFVLESVGNCDDFWVKESSFNLKSFLADSALAEEFKDGMVLIFRLAPSDYHRFHAPVDLKVEEIVELSGTLESVNPVSYAIGREPLKNKRVIVRCHNKKFGDFVIAPIGAMAIGKILLEDSIKEAAETGQEIRAGQKMGYFEFGGSSILVLVKKNALSVDQNFLDHSKNGLETRVLTGDSIGHRPSN